MKKITGDKVVWGIIGVGDVCEKKSAPAMNKIPGSEIRAVMRRNIEKAEDYARRHHISKWYNDVDQLLRDPEINAVYIATPPAAHAELTIRAAQAGKAVYVEKPMARTYKECLLMVEACEKAKVPLYVAYYRRALPNFLKIMELIQQGVIGDVRMVNIEMYKPLTPNIITHQENHWRVDPDVAGGGYFHDLASHQLDFLDFLFGPIKEAVGFSANQGKKYKADDIVIGSFAFANGVMGNGSWCFTTDESSDKEVTTIIGSKGQIEYGTFVNSSVIVNSAYGRNEFKFEMPEHIQEPLIRLVVDDLLGKGICPSTGVSGSRTNLVMEKICRQLLPY